MLNKLKYLKERFDVYRINILITKHSNNVLKMFIHERSTNHYVKKSNNSYISKMF